MPVVYGIGGLISIPSGPLTGNGPPPVSFKGQLGQQYFDNSTTPPTEYVFNSQTWTTAGANPASVSTLGTVQLSTLAQLEAGTAPAGSVVPLANDVFTFVNSVVIAGGNKATEAAVGLIQEATDAQAVAGTNLNPGTPLAVQPKSLAAVFASNPAIGGTAPNTGVFTTLGVTKMLQWKGGAATDFRGTGTLVAGTLQINNTNIATGDMIFLTRTAVNASTALGELSYTISNGASFTVNALGVTTATLLAADVSSFAYIIVRPI